ncbi:MAG: GIY-YIG nuclease family protein [Candidatus Aenigmatarchaeota archaeon]
MSKKLPSSILEDPIFEEKLKELMKGYSGIYALYKRDELYYVGLTKNLHGRIKWHLRDRHVGKWDKFVIFRIKKIRYLKDIETLIVNIAEPKGNRVRGKVPKDYNLNYILKDLLRKKEKEICELKKIHLSAKSSTGYFSFIALPHQTVNYHIC